MTTPETFQHVFLSDDGRRIAVQVTGPEDGLPVLFGHIAPGSRRFDPDPRASAEAGIRLITLDRPGYGGSDRLPDGVAPTVPVFADDCAAVLDHLGIQAIPAAGWSAGGRVVLALAARRPDLVRSVAVIGTPAPDDEVPWIGAEEKGMISALSADPDSALAKLEQISAPIVAHRPNEGRHCLGERHEAQPYPTAGDRCRRCSRFRHPHRRIRRGTHLPRHYRRRHRRQSPGAFWRLVHTQRNPGCREPSRSS